jgi:hypothetical protein
MNGQGVFGTLNAVSRLLLQKFARENEQAAAKNPRGPVTGAHTSLSGIGSLPTRR